MKIQIIQGKILTDTFVVSLGDEFVAENILEEVLEIINSDFAIDVKIQKLQKYGKVFEAVN